MIRGILRISEFFLRPAIVVPVIMAMCGCFAVLNASAQCADPYGPAIRHLGWLVVGLILLTLLMQTSIEGALRWAPLIAVPAVVLIYAGTFAPQVFAAHTRGTISLWPNSSWFIEPAELLRPVYVLVLARFAPGQQENRPISWSSFGIYLLVASVWWIPLVFEPDPGLLIVHVLAFVVVYWLQGGQLRQIFAGVSVFSCLVVLLYRFNSGLGQIVAERCSIEGGWVNRSAIAAAGLCGTPAGAPLWSQSYLPPQHIYMPFLSFAEISGFMGLAALLIGTSVAVHMGIGHSRRRRTMAEALIFAGAITVIAVEALLHFTVAGGLARLPTAPLTVFGFGGSSLIGSMVAVGLMVQYARRDEGPRWERDVEDSGDG